LNEYRIFETDNFIKEIDKIEGKNRKLIKGKLKIRTYNQLREQRHYGINIKKLKNYNPETWRYRIGNFRVFYEINEEEKIVNIIGISTRQNTY